MLPAEKIKLDGEWTLSLAGTGNLEAAHTSVFKRIAKGLATDEGLELAKNTNLPAALSRVVLKAQVPGDVHQDLQRAGLIEDPHLGLNEFGTQWIGRCRWQYDTTFSVESIRSSNELIFEGLDTIAEVYLNDKLILSARDMNIEYVVDVTRQLNVGLNHLRIVFEAQEDSG